MRLPDVMEMQQQIVRNWTGEDDVPELSERSVATRRREG